MDSFLQFASLQIKSLGGLGSIENRHCLPPRTRFLLYSPDFLSGESVIGNSFFAYPQLLLILGKSAGTGEARGGSCPLSFEPTGAGTSLASPQFS